MDISKIALGTFNMLRYAVHEHRRKYNAYPKQIELHPAVYADLMCDMRSAYIQYTDMSFGKRSFMGVPLIEDPQATRPKLITSKNEVEYL